MSYDAAMRMMAKRMRSAGLCTAIGIAVGAALLIGAGPIRAAGFALDYEGARALGMATAGAASAADATTIFYNPAGLAYLPGSEYVAGGQLRALARMNEVSGPRRKPCTASATSRRADGPSRASPWVWTRRM